MTPTSNPAASLNLAPGVAALIMTTPPRWAHTTVLKALGPTALTSAATSPNTGKEYSIEDPTKWNDLAAQGLTTSYKTPYPSTLPARMATVIATTPPYPPLLAASLAAAPTEPPSLQHPSAPSFQKTSSLPNAAS